MKAALIAWLRSLSGGTAKARNEQRKVISNVLNAGAIGSIAGVFLDMAREDSQFDQFGAILLVLFGFVCILLNYGLVGRMEEE